MRIDIEDWHTEDGLPEDRARRTVELMRPLPRSTLAERRCPWLPRRPMPCLTRWVAALCLPTPRWFIYNSFPSFQTPTPFADATETRKPDEGPFRSPWFSQTIAAGGRGLEALVAAFRRFAHRTARCIAGPAPPGASRYAA